MKKAYTKPYLAVESFQLNAAVASSCSSQNKVAMNANVDTCNFEHVNAGITQFGLACPTNVMLSYGKFNTYCYHGPQIDLMSIAIQS